MTCEVESLKYIFVTGGVVSSLGKGLTGASLGTLLAARRVRVTMQKLDPYLNVDPGTMSPLQHGEVFVTEDGAEVDLDIGHYERFLDVDLSAVASITTGKIYSEVLARERRGGYLGETVQVIPHITEEIKANIRRAAHDVDVVITEVGGTVGDIESLPFLEAIRQLRHEEGPGNVFHLHVSLVPYLGASQELKTKPTQHSVAALRSLGIRPDALVLRADRAIPDKLKQKIAAACDVETDAVVAAIDAASIYDIPRALHAEGLDSVVIGKLGLVAGEIDWTRWDDLVGRVHHPLHEVTVAVVGKYVELPDAYLSVAEALRAGGFAHHARVHLHWVDAKACLPSPKTMLHDADAIVIPGGFGDRGVAGKIAAVTYAREQQVPMLGLCLGLQCVVIEAARSLAGMPDADSTEFRPDTPHPVISTMADQVAAVSGEADLGGSMRLGSYLAVLAEDSLVHELYGTTVVRERHRHRYEVTNQYREELARRAGLVFSGTSPDGDLVEFVEYSRAIHPFLVATQAHPEFRSRPTRPHPLFSGLIGAALNRRDL
ncbi:CTP synthase [Streptosporangium sp. NPDC050280]|uniref:CTP synthase n=1 Tax=unclassified Streptosporangium TaxID=2632669 RepID=UPI00344ACEB9